MEGALRFVSDQAARHVLTWPAMVERLRRTYSVEHPPLASPPRSLARGRDNWMRSLTGVDPSGRLMGVKQFGLSRQKRLCYLITLFDQETGDLVALLDGHSITAMRTARRAVQAVRPVAAMTVFSTNPERRAAFARTFADEHGVPCRAVENAREAVRGASIIVGATRTRDRKPVLEGAWLEPGMLTVSIGATLPEQREIDVAAVAQADLIVADNPREIMQETGCFRDAAAAGVRFEDKFVSLTDLMGGRADDRVRASRTPMYRSIGGPLQDLAVAELALEEATRQGLTTDLPMQLFIKSE